MTSQGLVPVEYPTAGRSIWFPAGILALALHLAFAVLAVARMQQPEDAELGAPGIAIGLELASVDAPPSDLPPGPEADAAAASPAVVEQTSTVEETELPKDSPVDTDDPDRVVALEKPKTLAEEDPQPAAKSANPSDESVPQEAAAPPAIQNAQNAPVSMTRDQGTGASRQRARMTWQKELAAHLDKHKRYPSDRNHKSAEIVVDLQLDRTGRVVAASVSKSSGDASFDAAALAMIRRADPVPAPPPLVADEGLSFSLPVIFRPNAKR